MISKEKNDSCVYKTLKPKIMNINEKWKNKKKEEERIKVVIKTILLLKKTAFKIVFRFFFVYVFIA